ncbi:hypothetical protein CF392_15890 [Tamilnaduibacter salinus]|uniref:Capsule synthesis protein CapA domain-containing protein n=1 Tax=Tamilnaduibacter salinus TaxID=1484056 RepID=A0A2A2HZ35_9GAMM|nr:CapA family protein [Tamilnaduibacter salinus]PAV24502.1 hypothetical protein CF392_15890 [Tamilnaduibacter salinus]
MTRIMFVGDINLGEYYTSFGHGPRTYLNKRDVFGNVKELLHRADLVVGNLEAPLTNANLDHGEPESMVLRGKPQHADILFKANFRFLQLANNHTVQHGPEGFEDTVSILRAAGIEPIGIKDQDPSIITINGETFGFLAASDVPDNTNLKQDCYQRLDEHFTEKVMFSVKKVDHLFILLHWGLEASTSPLLYQKDYIERLYSAGVRGVIGSHPHLFYEISKNNNFVSAPSLGNFVLDLAWDKRLLQSGILDIDINRKRLMCQVWKTHLTHNGCLPTPTRKPIPVTTSASLYNLGNDMSGEMTRKALYFLKNSLKGNLRLKFKFILRKLSKSMLNAG